MYTRNLTAAQKGRKRTAANSHHRNFTAPRLLLCCFNSYIRKSQSSCEFLHTQNETFNWVFIPISKKKLESTCHKSKNNLTFIWSRLDIFLFYFIFIFYFCHNLLLWSRPVHLYLWFLECWLICGLVCRFHHQVVIMWVQDPRFHKN